MEQGCIQLYLGYGKGKTTAGLGQCLRAAGAGLRVAVYQFLKGSPTAELGPLETLGIPVVRTGEVKKFVRSMTPEELEECRRSHQRVFAQAASACREGKYDLVMLDEVVDAMQMGLIDKQALLALLREKAAALELVLTGHEEDEDLICLADYYSQIICKKHPYQRGLAARRGIEY